MDKIDYFAFKKQTITGEDSDYWYGTIDEKPQIERDLFKYQQLFFDEDDVYKRQQHWSKMFDFTLAYARSFVKQRLKNKKFIEPDEVEDYAVSAAYAFMRQYLYRQDFKCIASFGGMIQPKVVEAMYRYVDDDHNLSLENSFMGKDDEMLSLADYSQAMNVENIFYTDEQLDNDPLHAMLRQEHTLGKAVNFVIQEILSHERVTDVERAKVCLYLRIVLLHPVNRHVKPSFIKYVCKTKREIDLCEVAEVELLELLREFEAEMTI